MKKTLAKLVGIIALVAAPTVGIGTVASAEETTPNVSTPNVNLFYGQGYDNLGGVTTMVHTNMAYQDGQFVNCTDCGTIKVVRNKDGRRFVVLQPATGQLIGGYIGYEASDGFYVGKPWDGSRQPLQQVVTFDGERERVKLLSASAQLFNSEYDVPVYDPCGVGCGK